MKKKRKIKFALEFDWFRVIRRFSEGITFFIFEVEYDKYEADHKPSFTIMLIIFNLKIVEFSIHNIYHHEV